MCLFTQCPSQEFENQVWLDNEMAILFRPVYSIEVTMMVRKVRYLLPHHSLEVLISDINFHNGVLHTGGTWVTCRAVVEGHKLC